MVRKNRSNKKIISFSGPSCSGKTTIVNAINWDDYFDDYKLVGSHTRVLKSEGLKICKDGDDKTQRNIIKIHMKNFNDFKYNKSNVITDRCILDGMAYTEWLHNSGKVSKEIFDYASSVFMKIVKHIDILFYCEPVEYKDDNDRKMSKRDHDMVCGLFTSYAGIFDYHQVVKLTGTVDERLKIVDGKLK